MFAERHSSAWRLSLAGVLFGASLAAAHQVRDTSSQRSTGTAAVTGVVVDDSPVRRPLRRALVAISGDALAVGRSVITDDNGRFTADALPPGRVNITATKAGYVPGAFGATRPGRPGTPAILRAGATLDTVIQLTRTAAVTGVIRDERGEPIMGVRVFALDGARPQVPTPGRDDSPGVAETDERGRYRVHGLAPGDYVVAAVRTESTLGDVTRPSPAEVDAVLAWLKQRRDGAPPSAPEPDAGSPRLASAPSYYPGTPELRRAGRIRLGAGDVRDGLDFVVSRVPVTTVEGMVVADGGLPASVELSITTPDALRFFALGGGTPQLRQKPGADGRFTYSTILPGRHVITARGIPVVTAAGRGGGGAGDESLAGLGRGGNRSETLYAMEEVVVTGGPVVGVTLTLRRGARVAGRIVLNAIPAATLDVTTLTVTLQPPPGGGTGSAGATLLGNMFGRPAPVPVNADGSFEVAGVAPGDYTLQVTVPPAASRAWWLRSAISESRDLLDTGLRITPGSDVSGLTLTVTNQQSGIGGALQAAEGTPAADYFVIVMPAHADAWRPQSRRVRMTRPASDGSFSVLNLPAGDYLLVALTDVEPNEWQKPEFLAAIAPAGVKVTLSDGEFKQQALRISQR